MEPRESFRDVENLRFRFQMNNRLRLECLAAVSKVFRDFEEPIADDLLAGIVFALPEELVSANGNGNGHAYASGGQQAGVPPESPQQPTVPPESPQKPGIPPQQPNPPDHPKPPKPGIPPQQPNPPDHPKPPPKPGNPPDHPKHHHG